MQHRSKCKGLTLAFHDLDSVTAPAGMLRPVLTAGPRRSASRSSHGGPSTASPAPSRRRAACGAELAQRVDDLSDEWKRLRQWM
jgi:hypothetical protein